MTLHERHTGCCCSCGVATSNGPLARARSPSPSPGRARQKPLFLREQASASGGAATGRPLTEWQGRMPASDARARWPLAPGVLAEVALRCLRRRPQRHSAEAAAAPQPQPRRRPSLSPGGAARAQARASAREDAASRRRALLSKRLCFSLLVYTEPWPLVRVSGTTSIQWYSKRVVRSRAK